MLNLAGLFYVLNKQYNVRVPNTSVLLEDASKIVSEPTTEITFPIKIHMKDVVPFQREAFEIIKDKFELVEDLNSIPDYEIVSMYGETCQNGVSDNQYNIFPFIRGLFLEKCKYELIKGKRIFITKKNSELIAYHGGVLKRFVLNENELVNMLKKYNFEYIQLEDYPMNNKIQLFMESEMIISTNSSALTFTLFSNKNTKIIEIVNKGSGCSHEHFKCICDTLNLNYNRHSIIVEDSNGNFNINVAEFEQYLLTLI